MQSITAYHAMQISITDQPAGAPCSPGVQAVPGESPARARLAALALGSPLAEGRRPAGPLLMVGETDAWLEMDGTEVRVAFDSASMRHRRRGGQNELLGRAVGVKAERKPLIWDATAGLGRDAFVLADLGCHVTLNERIPVLAWLLSEAVNAASVSAYQQVREAAVRMTVMTGDSRQTAVPPEAVLYLDPMFPERKKTAAVKKDAVMRQRLAGTIEDVDQLWSWAWAQPVERIVVKRPLRAPLLGSQRPSHTLSGKSVRFDVFVRPRHVDPAVGTEV